MIQVNCEENNAHVHWSGTAQGAWDYFKHFSRATDGSIVYDSNNTSTKHAQELKDVSSHWAKEAVNTAKSTGIISGYSDGSFRPQENATRAEAVTVINRLLNYIGTASK